ncbi:MAG: hypothetical protein EOP34_06090 [Rickettsiales bacterium]|nr:MAG: hypothetical protein EOP34_06090 [Rickettsiales bacterium]
MVLSSRIKSYIYIRGLDLQYPNLARFLYYLLDIIYSLSLAICTGYIANCIVLPLINKLIICLKNIFNGILYMSGNDKGNIGIGGSYKKNSTPEPGKPTDIGVSKAENKKKKNKKNLEEDYSFEENYDNFFAAIEKVNEYGKYNNKIFNLPRMLEKYREYLPPSDKIELTNLLNKPSSKENFDDNTTVKRF